MHEASIVESLLSTAAQHVPDGRRLRLIEVRVGLLTGVSPESMRFYFDILRERTRWPEAELCIRVEPLHTRCRSCGQEFQFTELVWTCPRCGSSSLSIENGGELDLVSLEVDDGESGHDRAEDPAKEQ